MRDGSPIEWMLSLPLYHFLKRQSEPFGEPELTVAWERELAVGLKSAQEKSSTKERCVMYRCHSRYPVVPLTHFFGQLPSVHSLLYLQCFCYYTKVKHNMVKL